MSTRETKRFARGRKPVDKPGDFRGSLRRILTLLRPERLRISYILLLSVASVFLSVSGPKLLGDATNIIYSGVLGKLVQPGQSQAEAVDSLRAEGSTHLADMLQNLPVIPGQGIDFSALTQALLIVLAVYLGASLVSFVAGLSSRKVIHNTAFQLRERSQQKINRVPLSYLDSTSRGDLLSRVTNDIDNVSMVLQQSLTQFFADILRLLGMLAMMVWISWKLALVALIGFPLTALVTGLVMRAAKKHFTAQWEATGEVSGIIEEAFTGHEVAQAYGLQESFAEEFNQANDKLYRAAHRAQFLSGLMRPLMSLIWNLVFVFVAVAGGFSVVSGALTLGAVQAVIQYSRQLREPLGSLAQVANLAQSAVASAERIFQLWDAPEELSDHPQNCATTSPDTASALAADSVTSRGDVAGRIEFRNVTFGYLPDTPVIRNLNLVVEPGQTVAIVGPTGAGKTTLVNLLMRFYEVDSGAIFLDGVDISTLPRREYRSHFGMVLQDTWLLPATIAENIAYGRLGATEDEVREAARQAGVNRMIRALPSGYDTELDDDGQEISTGEKQLLTVARAFISRPQIMILDEATSSVDSRTEMLLGEALTRLRKNRTSFVIAHRLSTIRSADLIVVMEAGDVVEQGTHEELLTAGGAYARLYQAQFSTS